MISHRGRTLCLATILHCFTHLYMVALIPLYLPIQKEFKLSSIDYVTSLVTVQMMAYFLPSIFVGKLADKFSRKVLLSIGLFINSLAFVGIGIAPTYTSAMIFVFFAGIGGSFFHPAAIALIARLYPDTTGRALGIVGIGASAGFFIGPLYSGWRASVSGNWRIPLIELGISGFFMAILFTFLAVKELPQQKYNQAQIPLTKIFNSKVLWIVFLLSCLFFSLRDFAGGGMQSLTSLYLQKAHNWSLKQTGLALSLISLASAFSNPLFGHFSDKHRYQWIIFIIVVSSAVIILFPFIGADYLLYVLVVYGFFFMASFPLVEAALMQAFDDSIRGRVCGMFLTICSLIGNMAHWFVGKWVQTLGTSANSPLAYKRFYFILAIMAVTSLCALPLLEYIRKNNVKFSNIKKTEPALQTIQN
ncbi:MAG: MFS transporter [Verrucomicrobiia bacterium]